MMQWVTENLILLFPSGSIAQQEAGLIVFSFLLMLVVVIPVFVLTAFFSWKYRLGNTQTKYFPNWDHNMLDEIIWWAVPSVIIAILATIAWSTSHSLDPYRPLTSEEKPLVVYAVALDWKWLFIYPEENIATLNHLVVPTHRPISFQITADAPMNSFWIPELGGQVYAMAGMVTQLHIDAKKEGEYKGRSANFSGTGFADMEFVVKAVSNDTFTQWVNDADTVTVPREHLSRDIYTELVRPSRKVLPKTFATVEDGLFGSILDKYMMHTQHHAR